MDAKKYTSMKKEDFNFKRKFFYFLAKTFILYPYFKLFWKMKVYGKDNIEKNKKYIVCPNHISFLDPLIIATIMKRNVSFMSKIELFEDKFLATIVNALGSFAVNREKLEKSTIKTVREIFKTDWLLGIFPQGGIFRYDPISHVHRGFIVIAKYAQIDILPIGITGTEKFSKQHISGNLTVKIGKPISYTLTEDEIMLQWAKQTGELTGYGNAPAEELKEDKVVDNM